MAKNDQKRIGELIRKARKDKKLNQQELAEKVKLAQMVISDLEQGKRALKVDELAEFASALDVPITYFIENNFESEEQEMIAQGLTFLQTLPKPVLEAAIQMLRNLSGVNQAHDLVVLDGSRKIIFEVKTKRIADPRTKKKYIIDGKISLISEEDTD